MKTFIYNCFCAFTLIYPVYFNTYKMYKLNDLIKKTNQPSLSV